MAIRLSAASTSCPGERFLSKQAQPSREPPAAADPIPRSRRLALFFPVVVGIVAADLVSKRLIFSAAGAEIRDGVVRVADTIRIIPGFFELQCVMNQGAFSGWFAGWFWFLIVVSIAALGAIAGYVAFGRIRSWSFLVSLSLIASGTAGNLYDRCVFGAVRDFFRFFIQGTKLTWPNFNVADMSICAGVGLWILVEFRAGRKAKRASSPSSSPG